MDIFNSYVLKSVKIRYIKCIFHIIFSFSLFFNTILFAQSITWQRTYDGPFRYKEEANNLCLADNNNFYAIGDLYHPTNPFIRYIYVIKLNPYGDTIWTRYIGWTDIKSGYASVPNGIGGCVFTGDGDTSFTAMLDFNGNFIWWKNYGTRAVSCFDIKRTLDKGYIACGYKYSGGIWYGYALKIDSLGNLQWQNIYSSTNTKGYNSVEICSNGGYILAGYICDTEIDTLQVLITRIDNNGGVLWEKRYSAFDVGSNNARRIEQINNGYLVSGITLDSLTGYGTPFIMKINTSGNIYFAKRFRTFIDSGLRDFKIINSNRYIYTEIYDSTYFILNSRVTITDSNGNILREKIFTTPNPEGYIWLESILPLPNGDILVGGFSELTENDSTDIFLARTDSLLNAEPPIMINPVSSQIPSKFDMKQNYPNPFNPMTSIKYEIPRDANIKLTVYDITGREIISIHEYRQAGVYTYAFDGTNLASGVYIYKVESGNYADTKKMVLIK